MNDNWETKLKDDEIVRNEDGKKMVLLRGLKRLAREAGMVGSSVELNHVNVGKYGFFQCVYTANFHNPETDRTQSWSGSADCNQQNTEGSFLSYPTAVAESRAAARCLKDALGISLLSYEEIGFNNNDVTPDTRIDKQVVTMIQTMLDRKGLDLITLFRNVLSEDRLAEVVDLKELTAAEGQAATSYLNSSKSKVKKSPAATRSERKAQLEKDLKSE